jgi:hypothetical protein
MKMIAAVIAAMLGSIAEDHTPFLPYPHGCQYGSRFLF